MDAQNVARQVIDNVEKVIVGKRDAIQSAVICLLCEGHLLIEDVPGVGKTMLAKSLARSIGCTFKRIQFCLLYTSPSPRDRTRSRMPSSA